MPPFAWFVSWLITMVRRPQMERSSELYDLLHSRLLSPQVTLDLRDLASCERVTSAARSFTRTSRACRPASRCWGSQEHRCPKADEPNRGDDNHGQGIRPCRVGQSGDQNGAGNRRAE